MVLIVPQPRRLDWVALMEEAKREVEAQAQRRELTTKTLEAALDLLRAASLRQVNTMLAEDHPEAAEAAKGVAHAVQALFFVLNALDRACFLTAEVAKATDKEVLLGGEGGDIRSHGQYVTNKARQMSLPFLRGRAALDIWLSFLLETRLAPDGPLVPVLEAMNVTARGDATDFFRHPEGATTRPARTVHQDVRRLAVAAVEALLKAETLEHGTPPRGAKRKACEEVAQAFPQSYRLPGRKGPSVSADVVERWHEDFAPLLHGGEARGANERRNKRFTQWDRKRWEEIGQMLRGEHPEAQRETPPDAAFWRRVAVGWCEAIKKELAIFLPAEG